MVGKCQSHDLNMNMSDFRSLALNKKKKKERKKKENKPFTPWEKDPGHPKANSSYL